jgi:hypothetical protein
VLAFAAAVDEVEQPQVAEVAADGLVRQPEHAAERRAGGPAGAGWEM